MLLIFNPDKTMELGKDVPAHGSFGEGHVAFSISEAELNTWRDYLTSKGVEIETEITWPGGGKSIYFRDPANNSIELATPQTWKIAQN